MFRSIRSPLRAVAMFSTLGLFVSTGALSHNVAVVVTIPVDAVLAVVEDDTGQDVADARVVGRIAIRDLAQRRQWVAFAGVRGRDRTGDNTRVRVVAIRERASRRADHGSWRQGVLRAD